ncbi:MAG: hypothetical protein GWN62_15155 [Aliifodinibius sp.]|nr:hypothetical protein [Fodinibius sp.]
MILDAIMKVFDPLLGFFEKQEGNFNLYYALGGLFLLLVLLIVYVVLNAFGVF